AQCAFRDFMTRDSDPADVQATRAVEETRTSCLHPSKRNQHMNDLRNCEQLAQDLARENNNESSSGEEEEGEQQSGGNDDDYSDEDE
ncbi:hypothetical protein Tco_1291189, partial [Tanacetum coccineum]